MSEMVKNVLVRVGVLLVIFIVVILLIVNKRNNRLNTDNSLIHELKSYGYNVELKKFQEGRSESLPFSQEPEIIEINEEELFLFIFKNDKTAKREYMTLRTSEQQYCFYKEQYIIYYKGNDEILKNQLTELMKTSDME